MTHAQRDAVVEVNIRRSFGTARPACEELDHLIGHQVRVRVQQFAQDPWRLIGARRFARRKHRPHMIRRRLRRFVFLIQEQRREATLAAQVPWVERVPAKDSMLIDAERQRNAIDA